MAINIKEMARKAGVSVATITRAIDPQKRHKVAPKTLKKVDSLIKKYKYTPNFSARNLKKGQTKTIGVIFPYFMGFFHHGYYLNILAGVSDYLLNTDYQFKILLLKQEAGKWDYYDFKKGEHVDGIILENWPYFFSDKSVLEKMGIPCVVVSDFRENVKTFFACGDQVDGGRQVAEYLYGMGHRSLAVLTGFDTPDSHQRLQGFRDYLKIKDVLLNKDWIIQADFREDMAYEKTEELLKGPSRPTAIFCLNDQMAFGVLRKLKELNIECPQGISVVGFDNDPRSISCSPPLTTVNVPLYDLAVEAVRRIIEHLQSSNSSKVLIGKVLHPVKLIVRNSVQKIF